MLDFKLELSKLSVKDGDLVLVHAPEGYYMEDVEELAQTISDALSEIGTEEEISGGVLILPHGISLEVLDDEELALVGLKRITDS